MASYSNLNRFIFGLNPYTRTNPFGNPHTHFLKYFNVKINCKSVVQVRRSKFMHPAWYDDGDDNTVFQNAVKITSHMYF